MQLLLACARWFVGTSSAGEVQSGLRDLGGYERLMQLAQVHWIEPIVAWCLKTECTDMLDAGFAADLDRVLRRSTRRDLLLRKELLDVARILQQNSIAAVPLKGPVLSAALCEEVAWRESCDLDLLVRRADITCACQVLIENGYQYCSYLPPGQERARHHYRSQVILLNQRSGIAIDLHWQVVASTFPSGRHFESLWERVEQAVFNGQRILTLCLDDQLLFLCAHAARHAWSSMRLAIDIAGLISVHPGPEWDTILDRMSDSDARLVLALGLWMVNQLLGLELPGAVLKRMSELIHRNPFVPQLLEYMLNGEIDEDQRARQFRLELQLADGWWRKFRCLAARALLPTEADAESLSLPAWLYCLYYAYRPARLVFNRTTRFLDAMSSRPAELEHDNRS